MAAAQTKDKSADPKPHDEPAIKESLSTTRHALQVGAAKIDYEATAGTLLVKDDDGKPEAGIFFVSYVKTDVKDSERRPITFCFNGGPGSSSVWLHLGAFGPKRIVVKEDGAPVAPYDLVDNPYSLLESTDLVFIDPVSTGYSRPAPGQDAKKFHGDEEYVSSVCRYIRQYVSKFERWDSPKYLVEARATAPPGPRAWRGICRASSASTSTASSWSRWSSTSRPSPRTTATICPT